ATLVFAGSTVIWGSAVQAEVYALATAAFLLLALTALRARSRRTAGGRADAAFFFAAGMALMVHQTLLFPALVLGAWVLARGFRVSRLLAALGWAALGLSIVLVLPVRSSTHPALDWGHDRSVAALWENLLRHGYGGLRQNPFRLDRTVDEILSMGGWIAAACGFVGAALAGIGALLSRRGRSALAMLTWAALSVPAALVALVAFTPDAEHLAQIGPFLAPVAASLALWAGEGIRAGRLRVPITARPALGAAVAAALVLTAALHYRAHDRSRFTLPARYGRELLGALPQGATLIVDGDNETFLAAYLTRVEGYRTDLRLIHRRGYVFGDPYGLEGVPRAKWVEIAHEADLERLRTSRTPVYYATPPADLIRSDVRFVNEGLAYRAYAPGSDARTQASVPAAGPRTMPEPWPKSTDLLPGGPKRYDYVTRKLAVTYSDSRAQALWQMGRFADALPWFQDAAEVGFDFPAARMNLSVAAAAAGEPELALTELMAARRLAPYDPEPSARLAVFFAAAGRYRDAAIHFERAYRILPSAELASDAARAWSLAGDRERARLWEARG
ncbi:MAG: DUF2723 domain-containing protein, partial [Candidatus Latescibacteria bacterium]|nr:DUF2723 domain-containing protein [Candidatus Latescibacterota bacterium]